MSFGSTLLGTVIGEGKAVGGEGELDLRRAMVPIEDMVMVVKGRTTVGDSGVSHRQLQATARVIKWSALVRMSPFMWR